MAAERTKPRRKRHLAQPKDADSESRVLDALTRFFLASGDFNGAPVRALPEITGLGEEEVHNAVESLVTGAKVTFICEHFFANPHVKPWEIPTDSQLEHLRNGESEYSCVYPSAAVIRGATDTDKYNDRPFTKRLLLAEGQLVPVYFELSVLEPYHADPRYRFEFGDYDGSIGLTDEFFGSDEVMPRDQVFLQTFGLGHDDRGERVVVVHLRYLHGLSPEHQQIWNAKISGRPAKMVYEYYQNGILNQWAEASSFYSAFIKELAVINTMADLMGRPPLFRETFQKDRPKEFALFFRPTLKNFEAFTHVLDKMLSENIDPAFFQGEVPDEDRAIRTDGAIAVRKRGTLAMLDDWLRSKWRVKDPSFPGLIMDPLRDVRKLRQKPAHAVKRDEYNRKFHQDQEDLIERVYDAVRALRLLLANHPKARTAEIPEWLQLGKIKHF